VLALDVVVARFIGWWVTGHVLGGAAGRMLSIGGLDPVST
jgi:hypothetical protein